MPNKSDIRAFRSPVVSPETPVAEVPSTSFADLIRMLAEGITDAQLSLDRASAQMMVELAGTKVNMVRNITETIDEKGNVTYTAEAPRDISLLELGMLPTFYQFSQATVEVAMDLEIVENVEEQSEGKGKTTLFANTSNIRMERKVGREVKIASKLTATLVPVPPPIRLGPTQRTETK